MNSVCQRQELPSALWAPSPLLPAAGTKLSLALCWFHCVNEDDGEEDDAAAAVGVGVVDVAATFHRSAAVVRNGRRYRGLERLTRRDRGGKT